MLSNLRPRALVVGVGLAAALLFGSVAAQAAAVGPDSYGYTADTVAYTFEDISGTGTQILADQDDAAESVPVGFAFNFYGASYSDVNVSTNALMTFVHGTGQYWNDGLEYGPSDVPAIAPLWDDWVTFGGADAVYYQTSGAPGNRRLIVQWNMILGYYWSPSSVTFQVVLFEGSNEIEFRYQDVDSGDYRSFGGDATVGIRDANASSNGRWLQWSHNQAVISNGKAIRFGANRAPVAVAKSITVNTDAGSCYATVAAAAVNDGSYDPDGGAVTLTVSPAGPYPVGTTAVTLTATDAQGASSSASASITVMDAEAPAITGAAASTTTLGPPNHKLVPVTINYSATDNCAVSTTLSVSSNEPQNGLGDGDTDVDWVIVDNHTVKLRAERSGKGTGRVYTITITAVDPSGNVTTSAVAVTVPKSQGKG